ncbi:MAG: hypothetical protein ACOYJG_08410 [Prevotella sp.]|jgi:hypothetical protein
MPIEIITNYKDLNDIRNRKEVLLKSIHEDNTKMEQLFHSLFVTPDALNSSALPSQRIKSVFSLGSGIFDGFLFGWKIYRKFKKKKR